MKHINLVVLALLILVMVPVHATAKKEEPIEPIVIELAKTSTLARTMDRLADERLIYVG